jgi:hypothetical protein
MMNQFTVSVVLDRRPVLHQTVLGVVEDGLYGSVLSR